MSKKRRANANVVNGEFREVNPEPKEEQQEVNPETAADAGNDQNDDDNSGERHAKPSIKDKAFAAGSAVVKGIKHAGKVAWRNRGKIGIVAGAAITILARVAFQEDTSVDVYTDTADDGSEVLTIEEAAPEAEESAI